MNQHSPDSVDITRVLILLSILNKDFAVIHVVPYLNQMVVVTATPPEYKSPREYGDSLAGCEIGIQKESTIG